MWEYQPIANVFQGVTKGIHTPLNANFHWSLALYRPFPGLLGGGATALSPITEILGEALI